MAKTPAKACTRQDLHAANDGTDTKDACALDRTGELTDLQHSAIDLLVSGKTDSETARLLHIHRVTVARWRLHSPAFRAELATRRSSVWGAAGDRLRTLLPKALKVLERELDHPNARVDVALAVVKFARTLPVAATEATDAEDDVHQKVERQPAPSESESGSASANGTPSDDEQTAEDHEPADAP